MLPGRIILWVAFQNPTGGFEGVAKTGRNYRSPLFTFFTATAFWITAAVVIADESGGFDLGSSNSSGGLVKPGAISPAPAPSSRPSTPPPEEVPSTAGSAGTRGDSACEKAKKAATAAETLEELALAKAKVEALC